MEKIKFMSEEMNEEVDFYVLEQTKVGGVSYILVTEDDVELSAVLKVFEELLEDVEIER